MAWLERHLAEYKGTIVAVTHDRYFLDNVAGWILELDRGKGIPYEGNYSSWLEQKQARLAQEERTEKARQRTIAAELDWVRTNPKGRRTKSKARLARYEELVAEERNVKLEDVQIHIPPGPRLGDRVLRRQRRHQGLRGPAADRVPLLRVATCRDRRRDRRQRRRQEHPLPDDHRTEEPDGGTLELGDTVKLAYVDQSRETLDPDKTVWEEISGGDDQLTLGERKVNSRQYTAGFNFKGPDQQKRVGVLSGGERNRVHLAKVLSGGGNLLLLDEPTNDLDVDTLRALEQALLDVPGLRDGDLPRPLVPRPRRHARAGLRGRLPGELVRGQLRGLRGAPPHAARLLRGPPPPHHLQAAGAWLTVRAEGRGPFDRDTAVQTLSREGDRGSFAAEVAHGWRAGRGPHGGYLAAIILRALTLTLEDPLRSPRSLTIHFLKAPEEGPVLIETTIERDGRSLSSLSARMEPGRGNDGSGAGGLLGGLERTRGVRAPDARGRAAGPRAASRDPHPAGARPPIRGLHHACSGASAGCPSPTLPPMETGGWSGSSSRARSTRSPWRSSPTR